jgi:hypothetical protein
MKVTRDRVREAATKLAEVTVDTDGENITECFGIGADESDTTVEGVLVQFVNGQIQVMTEHRLPIGCRSSDTPNDIFEICTERGNELVDHSVLLGTIQMWLKHGLSDACIDLFIDQFTRLLEK